MFSDEVLNAWLDRGEQHARERMKREAHVHAYGRSNVRYQGDTLYSYTTPVGRIRILPNDAGPVYLLSSETYSATTAKLLTRVRNLVPLRRRLDVPHPVADTPEEHGKNLHHLLLESVQAKQKISRCRTERTRQEAYERAVRARAQAKLYCELFPGTESALRQHISRDTEVLHEFDAVFGTGA